MFTLSLLFFDYSIWYKLLSFYCIYVLFVLNPMLDWIAFIYFLDLDGFFCNCKNPSPVFNLELIFIFSYLVWRIVHSRVYHYDSHNTHSLLYTWSQHWNIHNTSFCIETFCMCIFELELWEEFLESNLDVWNWPIVWHDKYLQYSIHNSCNIHKCNLNCKTFL